MELASFKTSVHHPWSQSLPSLHQTQYIRVEPKGENIILLQFIEKQASSLLRPIIPLYDTDGIQMFSLTPGKSATGDCFFARD